MKERKQRLRGNLLNFLNKVLGMIMGEKQQQAQIPDDQSVQFNILKCMETPQTETVREPSKARPGKPEEYHRLHTLPCPHITTGFLIELSSVMSALPL